MGAVDTHEEETKRVLEWREGAQQEERRHCRGGVAADCTLASGCAARRLEQGGESFGHQLPLALREKN
jgi:hypothetical protein